MTSTISRRQFLSRAGTLAVGFSLAPMLARIPVTEVACGERECGMGSIPGWCRAGQQRHDLQRQGGARYRCADGAIQIVAEELYLVWTRSTFIQGDTSLTPGDQGYTAGSQTIQSEGPKLRIAAATAFQALLQLATQQFHASPHALNAHNGSIGYRQSTSRLTYAQLIGNQQIQLTSDPNVVVKIPTTTPSWEHRWHAWTCPINSWPRSVHAGREGCRYGPRTRGASRGAQRHTRQLRRLGLRVRSRLPSNRCGTGTSSRSSPMTNGRPFSLQTR